MSAETLLYRADGVLDAAGLAAAPGFLLLRRDQTGAEVLAAGEPDTVLAHPRALTAEPIDLPGRVLIPGLVNAHTHLDLTHMGPRPFERTGGFAEWGRMVLRERLAEPGPLAESVSDGIRRSLAGGVVAVGDIAGTGLLTPVETLRRSPLIGDSCVEVFGLGRRTPEAVEQMTAIATGRATSRVASRVRAGLSPHAPYTAGLGVYRAAAELAREHGVPVATHLAELPEEREFIATGAGPLRDFLEELGVWDDAALKDLPGDQSPVQYLAPVLGITPWLVAHVNDCSGDDMAILTRTRTSVAYCPRCSEYFGRADDFGPHRYREMLARGINVALGTDSIINIPANQAGRLSTLDEMRLLYRRDGADPRLLLRMATTNGARALAMDESLFTFAPGPIAGLVSIDVRDTTGGSDPFIRVLSSEAPAWLLWPGATEEAPAHG